VVLEAVPEEEVVPEGVVAVLVEAEAEVLGVVEVVG
jgi:hypothetical protein